MKTRLLGLYVGLLLSLGVMADVPISGLPPASALVGTELFPLVQSGSCTATSGTCNALISAISTYVNAHLTSAGIIASFTGSCSSTTYLRGDGACATPPGGGGSGTVTSVALAGPGGIFGISGSPVTTSGTLTFGLTGTSGGVPYFSSASVLSTSAALTANALVLGGGAGTAPGTVGSLGTTTTLLHGNAAGAPTFGSVSLTADISGILAGANGGTSNGFLAFAGPTTSLKTWTGPNANATLLTSNALVTVAQGGIGVGTLTGIALGNGTSAFTAAASSNVIGLWSGTCSSSSYLRGDGACASPAGAGTVTSVGLTAPSGVLGVTGSPITSSGSLVLAWAGTSGGLPYFSSGTAIASSAALTAHGVVVGGGAATAPTSTAAGTSGQVLTSNGSSADPTFQAGTDITALPSSTGVARADLGIIYSQADTQTEQATVTQISTAVLGNAFLNFTGPTTSIKTITFPNASTTALTTNALVTVAQGGIGAGTLTGIAKGNGTSAFTAAASSDVISLWSGTCSSSTFMRGDGACAAPAGGGTVTSVGLTGPGGIFGVSGSPVTSSGSITLSTTGTSGGIPYFSSSSALSTSAALTANALVLGGGAGTAPAPLGSLGTTTTLLHGNAAGAPTFGAVGLTTDVTGALPVANGGTGLTTAFARSGYAAAAECNNATANPAWNLPTSLQPTAACIGTSNTTGTLDYADAVTDTATVNVMRLPTGWTGNIDVDVEYTGSASSTNNFVIGLATACVADGADTIAPTYNTQATNTTAGPATAGLRKTTTFSAITATGCAAGSTLNLQLQRLGANAGDTNTGTFRFLGANVTIRVTPQA